MANTLRFKRGLVSGIPTAALGEPLFTTDTFDLYIGNGTGNTRFQKYIASGTTSQLLRGDGSLLTMPIVLTSPSNGQVLKYDGTNWVNSADAGVTGSGTAGQVTYWNGTGTITGDTGFTYDATNKRIKLASTGGGQFYLEDTDATSTFNITDISNNGGNFNLGTRSSAGAFVSTDYQIVKDTASSSYHRWFTAASTERMRLFNTGNLVLNSTTDNGLRFQVTGDGYFSGSVGIGASTGLADINLRITKALAGSVFPASISIDGTIAQAATSAAVYVQTSVITEAAAFTLPNLYHFRSTQRTFGAGSTVVNQYGFFVDSSLVGATSNFGFYGNIASGTNRWNLYMNGTAANFLNGNTGIGRSPGVPLDVAGTIRSVGSTGASSPRINLLSSGFWTWGIYGDGNNLKFQNDATDRLTLNSDGNLGLGVTPSAWRSVLRAFELGIGSIVGRPAVNQMFVKTNAYTNSSAQEIYIQNGAASQYLQTDGIHAWYNAPSGTAGNAITFTQAMTLDASGHLALGSTSADPFSRGYTRMFGISTATASGSTAIELNGGSGGYGQIDFGAGGVRTAGISGSANETQWGSLTAIPAIIFTNSSERIRVFSDGNVGIATGSTNAGYKLDVNGTMRVSGATTLGDTSSVTLNITGGRAIRISGSLFMDYATGGTGDFIFRSGAGFTERMRLDASGNLGLGTTSPSAPLMFGKSVYGNPDSENFYRIKFQDNGGVHNDVGIGQTVAGGLAFNVGAASSTQFFEGTNGERMRLWAGGNLAIGGSFASNSGELLQVNGTMRVSGASTFNGQVTVASHFLQSSAGLFRIENSGASAPTGATGVGVEISKSGSIGYIECYNRTTAAYEQLNLRGSTLNFTGAATFSSNVTAGGTITIARGQDANVTNLNINSGVTPVSAFQINTDQPNLRSILMARNGYSLVLGTQDANRVTIDTTGAATFSSSVTSTQFRLSALNTAPATSSSTGTLGEIRIDADYIYICTATNTWKRVAIATF